MARQRHGHDDHHPGDPRSRFPMRPQQHPHDERNLDENVQNSYDAPHECHLTHKSLFPFNTRPGSPIFYQRIHASFNRTVLVWRDIALVALFDYCLNILNNWSI